jgi:hypothetical protein
MDKPRLRPARVPAPLRELIPLAERWDIGDDYDRGVAVRQAPTGELRCLVTSIDASNDDQAWETWLGGPESFSPAPSPEYLAFTHLLMATDEARLELRERTE